MMELNDEMNDFYSTNTADVYIKCVDEGIMCIGDGCERAAICKRCVVNAVEGTFNVENFYTFGSGSASAEGIFIANGCGPLGNWQLFEPIVEKQPPKYVQRLLNERTYLSKRLMGVDKRLNKYCESIGITDYEKANLFMHNTITTDPETAQENTLAAIREKLQSIECLHLEKKQKKNVRKRIDPQIKEKIIAEYLAGKLTLKEICEKYDVSGGTVSNLISQKQKRAKGRQLISPSVRDKAVSEYLTSGRTAKEVSEMYGISISTLRKYLPSGRKGEPARQPLTKEEQTQILNDYVSSKLSVKAIAEKYKVARSTVTHLIAANNMQNRRMNKR